MFSKSVSSRTTIPKARANCEAVVAMAMVLSWLVEVVVVVVVTVVVRLRVEGSM